MFYKCKSNSRALIELKYYAFYLYLFIIHGTYTIKILITNK